MVSDRYFRRVDFRNNAVLVPSAQGDIGDSFIISVRPIKHMELSKKELDEIIADVAKTHPSFDPSDKERDAFMSRLKAKKETVSILNELVSPRNWLSSLIGAIASQGVPAGLLCQTSAGVLSSAATKLLLETLEPVEVTDEQRVEIVRQADQSYREFIESCSNKSLWGQLAESYIRYSPRRPQP